MKRRTPTLALLACLVLVLVLVPAALSAKIRAKRSTTKRGGCPLPAKQRVKLDLKPSSSLAELVAWVSAMTCKRFIVPEGLAAQRVTLLSPAPMTRGEAYQAFLSALEVMGLTVVPAGRSHKIARATAAKGAPIPTRLDPGKLPPGDQIVTQLYRPTRASGKSLSAVALALKSHAGHVGFYAPRNTLFITDLASNVRRVLRILERLDVAPETAPIHIRRLEHAVAAEVSALLKELFTAKASPAGKARGPTSPAPQVLVDRGTNALVIAADEETYGRMLTLVAKLDVASEGARPQVWVYRLLHGDAEQLAKTVSGLQRGGGARRSARGRAPKTPQGSARLFDDEVKVNADKANNALVIVATARDYLGLRRVLRDLDRPRRQVFIEAYILEINLSRGQDVGLAFHGGKQVGEDGKPKTTLLAGLSHGQSFNSLVVNPLSLMGLAAGVQGPALEGLSLPGGGDSSTTDDGDGGSGKKGASIGIPAFGVVLRALATNQEIDVLSSPHLLTTDNEEAEIRVGQEIPIVRGTPSPSTGNAQANLLLSLNQSVDRKPVGLSLKLTPTIGHGDTIRLALEQEASSVAKENFGELGASTYERLVRTVVTVKDSQTVVIGGLISEHFEQQESKIPLLGDIPIIGRLFRRNSRERRRTNMMVVMTPYIIHDQGDLRRIFRRKLADRREFIRRYTALRERTLRIDYRYKRGLLAEINSVGVALERAPKRAKQAAAVGPR